jgi:hypothetical protein
LPAAAPVSLGGGAAERNTECRENDVWPNSSKPSSGAILLYDQVQPGDHNTALTCQNQAIALVKRLPVIICRASLPPHLEKRQGRINGMYGLH